MAKTPKPLALVETQRLKTYHVYLRKGRLAIISAAGYTEDSRRKRFYFHSDMRTKDKQTFFGASDIAGIHECDTPASYAPIDIFHDWESVLDQLSKVPAALAETKALRRVNRPPHKQTKKRKTDES
jgi:hypothetical protein